MRTAPGAGKYAAMRCTSTATGGRNAVDARRQGGGREKLEREPMSFCRLRNSQKRGSLGPIKVRPEQLLCDAGCSFNCKYMFARKRRAFIKPTPYRRLGHPQQTRGRRLRTDSENRFFQGFERRRGHIHNLDLKDKL